MLLLTLANAGRILGVCPVPKSWAAWKPAKKPSTKGAKADASGSEADGSSSAGLTWTGEMRFRLVNAGVQRMEVHAVCLSYVGADLVQPVSVDVKAQPPQRGQRGAAEAEEDSDDSEGTQDEEVDEIEFDADD